MSFELYRQTRIGDCLVEALEELIGKFDEEADKAQREKLEELSQTVVKQFDASMLDALRNQVTSKAVIRANLTTYRFYDNVWQFSLKDVNLRLTAMGQGGTGSSSGAVTAEVSTDKAKVVCVDAKLLEQEPGAAAQ